MVPKALSVLSAIILGTGEVSGAQEGLLCSTWV